MEFLLFIESQLLFFNKFIYHTPCHQNLYNPASHYISFDVKTLNMKTINNLPFVFHSNKRKSYSSSSLSIDSSNDSSSSVFHLHTDLMIIRFRSIYSANDSLPKNFWGAKKNVNLSNFFFNGSIVKENFLIQG